MRSVKCRLVGLALVVAALALTGCIKAKFRVTVYPDSSGKAEVIMGLSQTLKMLGEMGEEPDGEDPFSELDLQDMVENSAGIVWGETEEYSKGGYEYLKVTGYFQDINEVELGQSTYALEKLEDGSYELTVHSEGGGDLDIGEDNPIKDMDLKGEDKAAAAMMKAMFAGFEIAQEFKLPGKVTKAEGMETEEREARFKLDMDDLLKMIENPEGVEGLFSGKIIAAPEGDITEEIAAFREEMEKALAEAEEEVTEEEAPPREEPVGKKEKKRKIY
jgi:hypothetical protein